MTVILRLSRIAQFSMAIYIALALLYTTNYLFFSPLHARISMFATGSSPEDSTPWIGLLYGPFAPSTTEDGYFEKAGSNNQLSLDLFNLPKDVIKWPPSDFVITHMGAENANVSPIMMTEDLFLSKAFAQSMRPSKIVPFFYRASGEFDKEDITLTTLVTSNRFKVFAQLVENYRGEFLRIGRSHNIYELTISLTGPISVTIHVKSTPADLETLFDSLHTLYTSTPSMSMYVDVHLIVDPFDRQFNTWRNIARLFARTDYVMMLDVDFAVCTDFRRSLRESPAVMNKLKDGGSAFVIPAFEYVKFKDGLDQSTFPKDKQVR
jgi:hypothetical protein